MIRLGCSAPRLGHYYTDRNICCTKIKPRSAVLVGARGRVAKKTFASAVAPTPRDNEGSYDENSSSDKGQFSPKMGVPDVTMAKGDFLGSSKGGGSATMEKSSLNFVMPQPVVQQPKLDDGGSGGDIGKIIHNGGGGGDGDGGDDDDYYGEGDGDGEGGDGEGGNPFFRTAIPEQYDTFSIGAVLSEWMRTIQELPAILRQAVSLGLFSSAQLVRFFAMDVRPSVTRTVSRRLPPSLAREFVGRLMADPGFVQKLVLESSFAACASLWFEYRARGDKFQEELDQVLIHTIGLALATSATVWLVAPTRSYGAIQKFPWQQTLEGLPNCVFDVSSPLRQFSPQQRVAGFFAKMAELSAVGALMGTGTSIASAAALNIRQRVSGNPDYQPSLGVPTMGHSSGGLAAYFALNANLRYQLVGGLDRLLFAHARFMFMYMALGGGARLASWHLGEKSRAACQGLPDPSTLPPLHIFPSLPRRLKKKVSKKVPKASKTEQQSAPQAQGSQDPGAATGMAMAAASVPLVSSLPDQPANEPHAQLDAHSESQPGSSAPHDASSPEAALPEGSSQMAEPLSHTLAATAEGPAAVPPAISTAASPSAAAVQ